MSRLPIRVLVLVTVVFASACRSPETPPRQMVTVSRPAGSWQGSGSRTIGFVSDSGRFRITWEARNEQTPGQGVFRLTVNSAVSGRPIQVVADQRGVGSGTADVADDPRPYNLMIDSANVDWSVSVDAVFVVERQPSDQSRNP